MAYTPTTWQDDVTPVNADNMNHIELALNDATNRIENLEDTKGGIRLHIMCREWVSEYNVESVDPMKGKKVLFGMVTGNQSQLDTMQEGEDVIAIFRIKRINSSKSKNNNGDYARKFRRKVSAKWVIAKNGVKDVNGNPEALSFYLPQVVGQWCPLESTTTGLNMTVDDIVGAYLQTNGLGEITLPAQRKSKYPEIGKNVRSRWAFGIIRPPYGNNKPTWARYPNIPNMAPLRTISNMVQVDFVYGNDGGNFTYGIAIKDPYA